MTDYEVIRRIIKDAFLAGVWLGQTRGELWPEIAQRRQADITATSKMQELVALVDIYFEDGRIVHERCEGE